MADNYLERKMEEHRKGSGKARRPAAPAAGVLHPGLHLQYPSMKVAVMATDAAQARPLVAALRAAGLNVALRCTSGPGDATALAQATGCRLYPSSCSASKIVSDFSRIGLPVSFVINLEGETKCKCATIRLTASVKSIPADILARELLFLLHPDHKELLRAQTIFDVVEDGI